MSHDNNVWDYLREELDTLPSDETLLDLPCSSPCGLECCKVIDAAKALMAAMDPLCHLQIVEAAEHAISINWRG